MRVQGRNREKKSILKISKSEFGLIRGLLYSCHSGNPLYKGEQGVSQNAVIRGGSMGRRGVV